mmetsp:Transcript_52008/g.123831  ORF Transcript_52008/g.123831 Transcript_52008/m.123831 type:complete len:434 (-) Transcript_52008:342-1643(-)
MLSMSSESTTASSRSLEAAAELADPAPISLSYIRDNSDRHENMSHLLGLYEEMLRYRNCELNPDGELKEWDLKLWNRVSQKKVLAVGHFEDESGVQYIRGCNTEVEDQDGSICAERAVIMMSKMARLDPTTLHYIAVYSPTIANLGPCQICQGWLLQVQKAINQEIWIVTFTGTDLTQAGIQVSAILPDGRFRPILTWELLGALPPPPFPTTDRSVAEQGVSIDDLSAGSFLRGASRQIRDCGTTFKKDGKFCRCTHLSCKRSKRPEIATLYAHDRANAEAPVQEFTSIQTEHSLPGGACSALQGAVGQLSKYIHDRDHTVDERILKLALLYQPHLEHPPVCAMKKIDEHYLDKIQDQCKKLWEADAAAIAGLHDRDGRPLVLQERYDIPVVWVTDSKIWMFKRVAEGGYMVLSPHKVLEEDEKLLHGLPVAQ